MLKQFIISNIKNKKVVTLFFTILFFSLTFFIFSNFVYAGSCYGGNCCDFYPNNAKYPSPSTYPGIYALTSEHQYCDLSALSAYSSVICGNTIDELITPSILTSLPAGSSCSDCAPSSYGYNGHPGIVRSPKCIIGVYLDGNKICGSHKWCSGTHWSDADNAWPHNPSSCTNTASSCYTCPAGTISAASPFRCAPITYTLTLNKRWSTTIGGLAEFGTITSNKTEMNCGTTCLSTSGTYNQGTVVTLNATAAPGYIFVGWSGGCAGTSTCTVSLATTSATVNARFATPVTFTKSALSPRIYVIPPGGTPVLPTIDDALNYRTHQSTATDTPNIPTALINDLNGGIPLTTGQGYYFQGNTTAIATSLNKFLKLDYYFSTVSNPSWIKQNTFGPSTNNVSGTFSSPFTATSSPNNTVYYYTNAYPFCIGDWTSANSWRAGYRSYLLSTNIGACDPASTIAYPATATGFSGSLCAPGSTITGPTPRFPDQGNSISWNCLNGGVSTTCSANRSAASTLTCSSLHLKAPADSPLVNLYVLTTWEIKPPVTSPDVTVHWTITDANGTATSTTVGSSELNKTFTTIGLKTVKAYMASTTGAATGNECTATTSITQQGGDNREN